MRAPLILISATLELGIQQLSVTGHQWIPLTKASVAELWCFFDLSLNKRSSKREAGDLRRHRAHCDVTVMIGAAIAGVTNTVLVPYHVATTSLAMELLQSCTEAIDLNSEHP